jgi:hypothetical protein
MASRCRPTALVFDLIFARLTIFIRRSTEGGRSFRPLERKKEKMFQSRKAICARHADIGMDKVMTLKQQRFVHRFRQCVSETIAEIQAGPRPSPPEVVVGLARQSALLQSDGFNDDGSGT